MRSHSRIFDFLHRTPAVISLVPAAALIAFTISCGGTSDAVKDPAPNISSFAPAALNVAAGGTTTLKATYSVTNGTAVVTPGNLTIASNTPLTVGPINSTTVYTLTVTSGTGKTATATTTVSVPAAPVSTITTSADATGMITKSVVGYTASVPAQAGCTYTWTPTNCTITAGATSNQVTFTAGSTVGATATLSCRVQNLALQESTGTKNLTIIDLPPVGLAYGTNPATYYQNVPVLPNVPSYTGGTATAFSVLPALPGSLSLHPTTGIISGTPDAQAASATYVVTASNSGGIATCNLSLSVGPQPAVSFSAGSTTIPPGGGTSLLWTIDSSISNVTISGTDGSNYGPFTASGSQSISPSAGTTYTLVANLAGGGTYTPAAVVVTVDSTPLAITAFSGTTALRGGNSDLSWAITGLPLTQALDGTGIASSARTAIVQPKRRQTYSLTAANSATSDTKTVAVPAKGVYHFAGSYGSGRGSIDGGVDDNGFSMGRLYPPNDNTVDEKANDGTMIIADYSNNLVRRITPDRTIRTIAGTPGVAGVAADNTTLTKLYQPRNTAVDPVTGDIYLGGEGFATKRLLKLTPVGDGTYTPSAVTGFVLNTNAFVISSSRLMYFIEFNATAGRLYTMDLTAADPATTITQLADLTSVVTSATAMAKDFNGGRKLLYVVGSSKIFKIDLAGASPVATLITGSGTAGFVDSLTAATGTVNAPQGVAVDTTGNVYIADRNNFAVRMIPVSGPLAGALITIAGKTAPAAEGYASSAVTLDGTATLPTSATASLSNAYYVAVSGDGTAGTKIYVADAGAGFDNQAIRIITVSGVGNNLTYTLDDPSKPAGYAYAGAPRVSGNVDGVGANAKFNFGTASGANLATLPDGSFTFAADTVNNVVRVIAANATVTTLKDSSSANFAFTAPKSVAVQVNPSTKALIALFVGDAPATKKIRKFTPNGDGTFTEDSAFAITGGTFPASPDAQGMTVDSSGTGSLYVTDATAAKVFKVDLSTGTSTDFVTATGIKPMGVALQDDTNGKFLWVAVYSANQVKKYDMTGALVFAVGTGTLGFADGEATAATFVAPIGIAVDGNGVAYVNNFTNAPTNSQNGIRAINVNTGAVTTLLGYATSTTTTTWVGLKPGLLNTDNLTGSELSRSLAGAVLFAPQGLTINAQGDLLVSTPMSIYQVIAPANK